MVGNHCLLGVPEAQYQYLLQKYPCLEEFVEKLAKRVAASSVNLERQLHRHVLGTPLLEVVSVKIYNDEGSAGACQVYGTIILIDGEGAAFNIYNRGEADAETVTMGEWGDSLTLVMPKGRAMCASGEISLLVDLKDATQGAVFANGFHTWDYKSKDDYDVVQTKKFGSAIMECITYRHAVIATIDITLVRVRPARDYNGVGGRYANGGTVEDVDVIGEVSAHCFRDYSITLFKRTEKQSVRLRPGSAIEMSRYVVVVPSNSSLVINPNLQYLDTKINIVFGGVMFYANHHCDYFGVERDVEVRNGHIRVKVHWSHAYMQPPLKRKLTVPAELDSEVRKRIHLAQDVAFLNGFRDLHPLPDPDMKRSSPEDYGILLMEVFSVSLGRNNCDKPFEKVHGIIKLCNCPCPDKFMFDTCLKNGTRVLLNEQLDIRAPEMNIVGMDFKFVVDLKDRDGRAISYGEVCWDENSVDSPIVWYGKPLCSVVRGEIGYAVLHYMLIPDGVHATVRVSIKRGGRNNNTIIIPSSNNNNNVHGSIFAEYSEYRYATWYDKEHYRHKLFQIKKPPTLKNGEEDSTVPCSDSYELALTRSAVVVPHTSALIIDLDLALDAAGNPSSSSFRDRLIFNIDMGREREQRIKASCGNAIAVVNVLWSKVNPPFKCMENGSSEV